MTELPKLYGIFLSKISDYRLLAMSDEDVDLTLMGYLESARAKFHRCKKRLEIVPNEAGIQAFGYMGRVLNDANDPTSGTSPGIIYETLTHFEIEILVTLMLVEHITPQLVSGENLRQSLSDKDFRIYSQANQLREIRLLLNNLDSKAKKMITEYTFFGLEKENM